MCFSFPFQQKLERLQDLSGWQIFQPTYKTEEKTKLKERVNELTQHMPQQFSTLLEGVCHPNFKVTVHDAALLQDLTQATHFIMKHQPLEARQKEFWLATAEKLDKLIQEKATLPLLNLPSEILYQIISYLSLKEVSKLVHACEQKSPPLSHADKSSNKKDPCPTWRKTEIYFTSVVKELIASYPHLLLEALDSTPAQQAHACQKLSKQWLKHNHPIALTNLFSVLHSSHHPFTRHYYLKFMTNAKLYHDFLNASCTKDHSLLLDILPYTFNTTSSSPSMGLPPLLQPCSFHLNHWQKLVESYSATEFLTIKTKFTDQLTTTQRKDVLLDTINKLSNVKHLIFVIPNLSHTVPRYFAAQIEAYRQFICNFSQLKSLSFKCRDVEEVSLQPKVVVSSTINSQSLCSHLYRRASTLASNIQNLLHADLQLQFIQMDINCLNSTNLDELVECLERSHTPYPILYLNHLAPAIIHGFRLKNVVEIQILIPKPSFSYSFAKISPSLSPQLQGLACHKEMCTLEKEDKLVFIFRKNPSPPFS